jgi:hypothetical protein
MRNCKKSFSNGETFMSRYELSQLIKRWEQSTISPEQAIGQLLLHMQDLLTRVKNLEQQLQRRGAGGDPAGDQSTPTALL